MKKSLIPIDNSKYAFYAIEKGWREITLEMMEELRHKTGRNRWAST